VTFLLGIAGGLLVDRLRSVGERRGALRRLRAEIDRNEEAMQIVRERGRVRTADMIGDPALLSLTTDAWDDAARSGVLPDVLYEELEGYYSPLEKLLSLLRMEGSMDEFMERWLRRGVSELKPEWNIPRSRNPYVEYLDQVLEAQDRVRDRITEYLARPWWRRMFGG
jgi:hypothetical protein